MALSVSLLLPEKVCGSRERRIPNGDARRPALQATDASSPPGAQAVRERGGGGGICASAKTPTAAAGSALTSRARRRASASSHPAGEAGPSLSALPLRGAESLARLPAPGWSWKEVVLWRLRFYF